MRIAILGPLVVQTDDGEVVPIGGARLRSLLIRLALAAGRAVTTQQLVDDLWGERPPEDGANALQSLVSRLRTALGRGARQTVESLPNGYRLALDPSTIDAHEFERLATAGRDALGRREHASAAADLRAALTLWRGTALADVTDAPFSGAPAARLEELRIGATEDRVDADLALGSATAVVAELEELVANHPLRERLRGQLMRALAAVGRRADALAVYEQGRSRLANELGVDPSPDLQSVHLAVLRGEVPSHSASTAPEADGSRGNLPSPLSSFVGREGEVRRLRAALDAQRLVTVLGPGGAGKTRLATQVAAALGDAAAGAVWFVALAPVTDPAEVAHTVLAALGRRDAALLDTRRPRQSREALEQLLQILSTRRALLVLDNCEHLLDAVAELAETLLARCPKLRVLATSREPLALAGENLVVLPPLATPAADADPGVALSSPAVQLFLDRARSVRPDFDLEESNVASVVSIVRRLDGLPLAIELAAARLRTLPVSEIAARLSDRFRLLTGGSRTALPRHRTLYAVVEWSWDLLTPPERLLAERISVFPAGVTPETATAVCASGPPTIEAVDVPDLLAALVDRSLLQLASDDGPRYRMLETIREFGITQLAARGELADARDRHARFFADLAAAVEPTLRRHGQLRGLHMLNAEHDNVLAALRRLCDQNDADAAVRLALNLSTYWSMQGRNAEAATWFGAALDVPGKVDELAHLAAEAMLGVNLMVGLESATVHGDDPRARIGRIADQLAEADTTDYPLLVILAPVLLFLAGDVERSRSRLQRALGHADPWVRASAHAFRARFAENDGDLAGMAADCEAALAGYGEIGDRWAQASVLPVVASVRTYDGDLDGALTALLQARDIMTSFGSVATDDYVFTLMQIAALQARRGELPESLATIERATTVAATILGPEFSALVHAVASSLYRNRGDLVAARRRQEIAEELLARRPASPSFAVDHGVALVAATGAMLEVAEGAVDAAVARLPAAAAAGRQTKDMPVCAAVCVAAAAVAGARGNQQRAATLLGAAALLRGADDPTNLDVRTVADSVRVALGESGYDDAWRAGGHGDRAAALDRLDAAIAALQPVDSAAAADPAAATDSGRSPSPAAAGRQARRL